MAWELGSNMDEESERAEISARLGGGRAARLYPDFPIDDFEPIVSRGTVVGKAFDPTAQRATASALPAGLGSP